MNFSSFIFYLRVSQKDIFHLPSFTPFWDPQDKDNFLIFKRSEWSCEITLSYLRVKMNYLVISSFIFHLSSLKETKIIFIFYLRNEFFLSFQNYLQDNYPVILPKSDSANCGCSKYNTQSSAKEVIDGKLFYYTQLSF